MKIATGIVLTLLLVGMLTLAFNIQLAEAEPRTWTVNDDGPADFHTIQEAINAASDGDTIFVRNGTYFENVVIGKSVSLIGENRNTTIIDGNHTGNVVYVYYSIEMMETLELKISGFTLQNGVNGISGEASFNEVIGMGASINAEDITIQRNGRGVKARDVTLMNALIQDNGGNGVEAYDADLKYCTIQDNLGCGMYLSHVWSEGYIFGCVIHNNTGLGVFAPGHHGSTSMLYSNITGNQGTGIQIHGDIHFSNIYGNIPYDVSHCPCYTYLSGYIDATYNWWGTTNTSLIDAHIYDWNDHGYGGNVSYEPFLTNPILKAVPPYIYNINRVPQAPNYEENVIITAIVRDDLGVDEALLSYTYNSAWHNVSMNRFDDTFNASIPSQPYGPVVEYRIYAKDTDGNWAESAIYSYEVIDTDKPEIISISCFPAEPTSDDFVKVTVNASEPVNASGVKEVLFSLQDAFGQQNTTMTYDSASGLWTITIPKQPYNTTIEFYVTIHDKAGNEVISQFYNYLVIPEFPSFLILPLFMIATLLAIIAYKRKH